MEKPQHHFTFPFLFCSFAIACIQSKSKQEYILALCRRRYVRITIKDTYFSVAVAKRKCNNASDSVSISWIFLYVYIFIRQPQAYSTDTVHQEIFVRIAHRQHRHTHTQTQICIDTQTVYIFLQLMLLLASALFTRVIVLKRKKEKILNANVMKSLPPQIQVYLKIAAGYKYCFSLRFRTIPFYLFAFKLFYEVFS